MDMSLALTHTKSAFEEQLEQTLRAKLASAEAERLKSFAQLFFDHYPIEELNGRDIHDIVGMLRDCYNHLGVYKQRRAKVRAYNPTLENDGWTTNNTVVTVHYNDVPFVIDSVRLSLTNQGITIKAIKNLIIHTERDGKGELVGIGEHDENAEPGSDELLMYVEIDQHSKIKDLNGIMTAIRKTITDVNLVNNHYSKMIDELEQVRDTIGYSKSHHTRNEIYETNQYIAWLMVNNFTFLGYAFFEFVGKNHEPKLTKSYGLLGKNTIEDYFPADSDKLKVSTDPLLTFNKSPTRSSIHRRAYPDHITIQSYDAEGNFVGVHHVIGLYTSQVYRASVNKIPLLRNKVEEVYERLALSYQSYNGKSLRQILETFPRDELFQSDLEQLSKNLQGILQINERSLIRLFMRESTDGRFVSAMVYIPRDKFSTGLRKKIIDYLSDSVNAESSDFYSYYSESILSRTYIIFRLCADDEQGKAITPNWSQNDLEQGVQDLASTWEDDLVCCLEQMHGEEAGRKIYSDYEGAFPSAYQEVFNVTTALKDIKTADALTEENPIALSLHAPEEQADGEVHFKLFNYGKLLPLSKVIPILERMDLKVIGEHPYHIKVNTDECGNKKSIWLHDFHLQTTLGEETSWDELKGLFENAFMNIWQGNIENDFYNGLVLSAQLQWREVSMLRAYGAYMKQTLFPFSKRAIVRVLMDYPSITQKLVELFNSRFNPSEKDKSTFILEKEITQALDAITNLNDDRILRHYMALIDNTLRTNYFQTTAEGESKSYLAFKFNPRNIPDMPEPKPMFEIFVYSPDVEGVHLRGGKVARGGLRWSDRAEDYRTEVLGLVKAQNVKNAVIVPNGAKGGFVARKASMDAGRDAFMKEGIRCYRLFISGLLDVTDNLEKGKVIPPKNVVRYDEDDPYLVVAADKGTATFSDIANEISQDYGHWLGDAFASGGSQGYDHKGMGITARGAWVSVQRHFREKGIDVQKEDFTVVAVGDMAGDVFGNGMLMSEHICLTAAFNHMHIFIDPNPNPASSFKERKRMFNTAGITWEDYNKKLISKGGGVFSRHVKAIDISPEMKKCFGITANKLTPNELIKSLLKSPVDLIWNGGIGTYVKSGAESHADVGDKANDTLRVNGADLRCKVFGEGGNLGMSQQGRIEYCMHGGACNTDFIDNAAGVDCSDHEVNIKILLSDIMSNGGLQEKQRNRLLADMTDTVSDMVLTHNYYQAQSISLSERESLARMNEYRRLINSLEESGRLNRALEFIPSDEELADRAVEHHPLTRPELAVLNCYVKVELKELLAVDEIANNSYLSSWVERAFPPQLVKKYRHNIHNHILRKEIIATQLANDMVDKMGITFCHRMMDSTGENAPSVAMAYVAARDVFQLDAFQKQIESLDYKVPSDDQLKLLTSMMRRVRRGTRWFLRNRHHEMDLQKVVDIFKVGVTDAIKCSPDVLGEKEKQVWDEKCEYFEGLGLNKELANMMAMPGHLFSGLGIAEAGLQSKQKMPPTVEMHHLLGDKLGLYWFAHAVTDVKVENYWQAMARESFIDDIDKGLRIMTVALLRLAGKQYQLEEALQLWMHDNPVIVSRWRGIAHDLQTSQASDFAMFSVAMRELMTLAEVCEGTKKLSLG